MCIGAVMVDSVCHVPALPDRGEGVVVAHREMRLGGCAFNSANMARQLGGDCFLMAPVGKGPFADFAQSQLDARRIQALRVETDLDCGMCFCMVEPNGERTMVTTPGIERRFQESWFRSIDASQFGVALAAGYEIEGEGGDAIVAFLEKNPQIRFYYAPGPRVLGVSGEKMERILAMKPLWHLNDLEAVQYASERLGTVLCGDRIEQSLQAGCAIAKAYEVQVVVTLGPDGSAVIFPDETMIRVPVDSVDPVDTVGAGDAHLGALAAARSAGLDWEAALRCANNAAASVCMVAGASLTDEQFAAAGLSL